MKHKREKCCEECENQHQPEYLALKRGDCLCPCHQPVEQKNESWEDELELFQLTDDGIDRFCCSKNYLKFFIQTQKDISYKEGRKSVLDEIKHDQRKMLDGFSHPKSCEQCFLIKEK